jgi:hypothetical protein
MQPRTSFAFARRIFHALSFLILVITLSSAGQPAHSVMAATEVIVEDPTLTPAYNNGMCGTAWYRFTNNRSHYAYLTLNTNASASSTNWATWQPNLPVAGDYKVEAFIATHNPINWQCPTKYISWDTSDAHYTIQHASGSTLVSRNQAPMNNQWLDLGTYAFNVGTGGRVKLVDLNDESNLTKTISFSAVRFTLVSVPPQPDYNTAWLTDAALEGETSTSTETLRYFFKNQNSCLTNPIQDVDGVTIDIPALVHDTAVKYQINPKVILATMQKEQSAITRCPEAARLKLLMGAGSPSTARDQIDFGASLFRAYQDELNQNGVTRSGWKVGVAKATADGISVTPASKAVAGQFTYTPYAGANWGGANGGVWLFWNAWYNTFHFDQALPQPPAASCKVPYFSQLDSRWKNSPLRTAGQCSASCNTIGKCGCTLTSTAMVFSFYGANTNPSTLSDCMGTKACYFQWGPAASACSQGKTSLSYRNAIDWGKVEREINQNKRPVILGMQKKDNADFTHWVVAIKGSGSNMSNYRINDPGSTNGENVSLSAYKAKWNVVWMAGYTGQSSCGGLSSSPAQVTGSIEAQPALLLQSEPAVHHPNISTVEAAAMSATADISGAAYPYTLTDTGSMIVQVMADTDQLDIAEMLVWTDSMETAEWQPYASFAEVAFGDQIFVRFKNDTGGISDTLTVEVYPVTSTLTLPQSISLPVIAR